ncbi:MAG: transporter substrate-binding domain-containing protein [Saccharospirillaceae bacterium]|nr:transporter substrate-binding domain-containing protein [Colwellia sp.]NRB77638.1 transporter substrate-binding domain-containing protein [Saccharospirillaceae bacterium]
MSVKKDNVWTGLDIKYGSALVENAGCTLTTIEAPWARGLKMLKTGEVDLMLNMSKNKLREEYYHFIGPLRIERIRLVSKKNSLSLIHSWEQLKRLDAILVLQRGSYFGKKFEGILDNNIKLKTKLRELADNDIGIKFLNTGRVDALVVDEIFIDNLPNEIKNLLDIHPLIINSDPIYYAFSKVNFDNVRIKKLQEAYNLLSKSPEFIEFSKIDLMEK